MPEHSITLADLRTLADELGVDLVRDMSGRYLIIWSWTADYIGADKRTAATELVRRIRDRPTPT